MLNPVNIIFCGSAQQGNQPGCASKFWQSRSKTQPPGIPQEPLMIHKAAARTLTGRGRRSQERRGLETLAKRTDAAPVRCLSRSTCGGVWRPSPIVATRNTGRAKVICAGISFGSYGSRNETDRVAERTAKQEAARLTKRNEAFFLFRSHFAREEAVCFRSGRRRHGHGTALGTDLFEMLLFPKNRKQAV